MRFYLSIYRRFYNLDSTRHRQHFVKEHNFLKINRKFPKRKERTLCLYSGSRLFKYNKDDFLKVLIANQLFLITSLKIIQEKLFIYIFSLFPCLHVSMLFKSNSYKSKLKSKVVFLYWYNRLCTVCRLALNERGKNCWLVHFLLLKQLRNHLTWTLEHTRFELRIVAKG